MVMALKQDPRESSEGRGAGDVDLFIDDPGSTDVPEIDIAAPEGVEPPKTYQELLAEAMQSYGTQTQAPQINVPSAPVRYLDAEAYDLQAEEKFLRGQQADIAEMERPPALAAAEEEASEFKTLAEQSAAALDTWRPARTGPYKTFTDRLLSAVGVGLGEVGRTLTGGKNVGLEMLNKIIDDEARRQQMEYQKLKERSNADQNAFTRSMNVLRNERLAFANTKERLFKEATAIAASIGRQTGASMNIDKINTEIQNQANQARAARVATVNSAAAKLQQDAFKNDMLNAGQRKKVREEGLTAETLAKDVGSAIGSLRKALGENPEATSRFGSGLLKTAAQWASKGNDEKLEFGSAVLKDILVNASDKFQEMVNFYNKISAIAFGKAAEGQSASSISNKDVQIFVNLLASPNVSNKQILDYMELIERKARASALGSRAAFDSGSLNVGDRVYRQALAQAEAQLQAYEKYADPNHLEKFRATRR